MYFFPLKSKQYISCARERKKLHEIRNKEVPSVKKNLLAKSRTGLPGKFIELFEFESDRGFFFFLSDKVSSKLRG